MQTPVIRFFGITKRGQKACMNIFDVRAFTLMIIQYYPFLYCEFPSQVFNLKTCTDSELQDFLKQFAYHLEYALYLSIFQKSGLKSPRILLREFQERNEQLVNNVEIAYKYPIYGYYKDKKPFIRIELYDPKNIKRCANLLYSGILYGIPLQPYEAHISYFMHFYGDYHLGGLEFIKTIDFLVRHLNTLEESHQHQILKEKGYFPSHFRAIQEGKPLNYDSDEFCEESKDEVELRSSQSHEQDNRRISSASQTIKDFSFLQNDLYLKLWYSDMVEITQLGQHREQILSPYLRSTTCDIEIDVNCKDVLNLWENDQNIVGSLVGQSDKSDNVPNQQFKSPQPFIHSEKRGSSLNPRPSNQSSNNHNMYLSQETIKTVFNDEEVMMQIFIDKFDKNQNDKRISEFASQKIDMINNLRKSNTLQQRNSEFNQASFSIQDNQNSKRSSSINDYQQYLQTPEFKNDKLNESNFDQQFQQYSQDIKEVRSLVNLWKEEFIRRKHENLPQLERAQMSDDSRQGGYSESLNSNPKVQQFLFKHLRIQSKQTETWDHVDNELYKSLEPIDYEALQAFITYKEQEDGGGGDQERFQMLGFFNMRQMQEARHTKAVQKNLQQQLNESIVGEGEDELEVLDIMESLKDQFENLMQRSKDQRQAKTKYKTGKIGNDIQNNRSIYDFMSPKISKQDKVDITMNEDSKSADCEMDDIEQLLLGELENNDEEEIKDLQESIVGIQNQNIKQSKLGPKFDLEEVQEELYSQDSQSNTANIDLKLLFTQQDANMEEVKDSLVVKESLPRYMLKGDKIVRIRSPRKRQAEAHFSNQSDLIDHLHQVRQIRNNRHLQLKDLKVQITDQNKHEILLDEQLTTKTVGDYIPKLHHTLTFKKYGPFSKSINAKYANKKQREQYKQQLLLRNDDQIDGDYQVKIDKSEKIKAKIEILKSAAHDSRFITPATQNVLKHLDSQNNLCGFEKQKLQQMQVKGTSLFDIHKQFDEVNGLTIMILEIFVCTRVGCVPNFEIDPITAIFFSIHNESAEINYQHKYQKVQGVIANRQTSKSIKSLQFGTNESINYFKQAKNEISLFQRFIELFREFDPDIIVGYETETQSIGYICKRAESIGIQMQSLLSRTPLTMKPLNESYYNQKLMKQAKDKSVDDDLGTYSKRGDGKRDKKQFTWFYQKYGQAVKLNGRIVLNLWSIMRHEVNLTNYDLENVSFHILKKRESKFDFDIQTQWWMKGQFYHVANYILRKIGNMQKILDTMDLINRDINMAKVYGIDYESILTRGSQFRVEAILSKMTKSQDFLLLTAAVQQVRNQNELEVIPLVVEPDKQFYTNPVIIVDFQSLYPSVIIAYNLCYSTCLGKIIQINPDTGTDSRKLGVYQIPGNIKSFFGFQNDQNLTEEQELYILDNIIIAPNLNCFVKPHIRLGLLPRMLREILYTRIMVKKSMKLYPPGSPTYKMLDSRQLALKLIANVTYGYTGAGFSGRMPCSELADSVVAIGRHTLEKTIKTVNQNEDCWGTRVIYGDTDSTFILCEGKTLEQTFQIGELIAKTMTQMNPFPMELKFEKVYFPCVTLAKKRYCGYKLEKISDKPVLDAKGIETIRRDSVDAVQKIMDKTLRLLFETKNLSQVKSYLQNQWRKIYQGDVDFKDFIFAKEVRYGTYRTLPPSAIVAERRLERDPGAMPRYKERIPYVIAMGQSGAVDQSKIKDLVLSPEEFLSSDGLLLNSVYYIKRQVNAALNRIFLEIFDIDVNNWYDKMPKKLKEQGVQSKKVDYFKQQISSARSQVSQSKLSSKLSSKSSTSIAGQNSIMIDQFYNRKQCVICSEETKKHLCKQCASNIRETLYILHSRLRNIQNQLQSIDITCMACSNMLLRGRVAAIIDSSADNNEMGVVPCVNYQCKVFYDKMTSNKEYQYLKEILSKLNLNSF